MQLVKLFERASLVASKTYATDFIYGDIYSVNLIDEDKTGNKNVKVVLFPFKTKTNYSQYNQVVSREYTGSFLVMVNSNIDEGFYEQYYWEKYKNNIAGLEAFLESVFLSAIINGGCGIPCNEVVLQSISTEQIINYLDQNYDGLLVTYSIKLDRGFTIATLPEPCPEPEPEPEPEELENG